MGAAMCQIAVKELGALLGMGILTSNSDLWAHQRKVIAPKFFMDKVKVKFSLNNRILCC